jgi:uncharacterized protein GlcG (DUF336 family)
MRRPIFGLLLVSLFFVASAQTPPAGPPPGAPGAKPARGPSLAAALDLAQGAIVACAAQGYAISVTVADSAGNAKVTLAADGSGGRTSTSLRKAASAAIFKASGAEIAAREKTDPALAAKIAAAPTLYSDHPGSLPLLVGTEVIGGIGVAGAPSHEQDAACAQAAVARYGNELR